MALRSGAVFFKHLFGEGDVLFLSFVLRHPLLRVPGIPLGLALRMVIILNVTGSQLSTSSTGSSTELSIIVKAFSSVVT